MRKSFFISGIIMLLIFVISSNSFGDNQWISIGPEGECVHALAINPQTPGILYAGTVSTGSVPGGGVFKSTDGGANWTAMNTGLTNPNIVTLAIDPQAPDTIYAGTCDGVFKSTNGGTNWTAINNGLPYTDTFPEIYALAINPQTPDTLYAGTEGGVFESTNGGTNWTAMWTAMCTDNANMCTFLTSTNVVALVINPQTPDTLYAGYTGSYGGGVFESTDGGTNWTAMYSGFTEINALVINPQTPDTLYAGGATAGGGGVFESTNGGAGWIAMNNGLPNAVVLGFTEIIALAINPQTPDILYASTASGVFESTNGGANWIAMNNGLSYNVVIVFAINPQTPGILYAGTNGGGIFKLVVAPVINMSVTTTSVNLGSVNVGQAANQAITITNQASSNAALAGNVGTLSAPFSVLSGGGTFNLAPGQSITVTIQFSPTTAGPASASLSITHNATNQTSPTNISLSGTGVNFPIISVTPMSNNYGNVKVKRSKTTSFVVKNSGKANLSITSAIAGTDASMFTITGGSGGKTIKPRRTMTIRVAFKPTSKGSKSANLEITSNDSNTPTIDIPLSGTGQ